jgi:hypothetical protein
VLMVDAQKMVRLKDVAMVVEMMVTHVVAVVEVVVLAHELNNHDNAVLVFVEVT